LILSIYTVIRTTQRTSNLAVILLGAGLSAVLIYALTSELFSRNSPTVLFNDACDRINASARVCHQKFYEFEFKIISISLYAGCKISASASYIPQ
jgi:hypothetical protein